MRAMKPFRSRKSQGGRQASVGPQPIDYGTAISCNKLRFINGVSFLTDRRHKESRLASFSAGLRDCDKRETIDPEAFHVKLSSAGPSDGDGSNRQEKAVSRCAGRKMRAGWLFNGARHRKVNAWNANEWLSVWGMASSLRSTATATRQPACSSQARLAWWPA